MGYASRRKTPPRRIVVRWLDVLTNYTTTTSTLGLLKQYGFEFRLRP